MADDGVDLLAFADALEYANAHPDEGIHPPIPAGRAPHGLVFQTWAGDRLLHESAITGPGPIDAEAEAAATKGAAALGTEVELRVYDGDTGAWVMSRVYELRP